MFLVATFLLMILLVRGSLQVCAPDCTGVDPGFSVKDPTDCTKYYICLDTSGDGKLVASSESLSCPDGQFFLDEHTIPRCTPLPEFLPNTCKSMCNPCVPNCPAVGALEPHPINCSRYYVCLEDNHVIEESCPPHKGHFDYKFGECTADNTVCYNYCDPCVPHCTTVDQRVEDPYDCTKFHLCIMGGLANFKCPHHQVYNRYAGLCEENVYCLPTC
ncbi:uncharacterized protein LOC121874322 [Homarus americanus]|nr:uncharacterized protein LOC121874322 [Homarus americanus]